MLVPALATGLLSTVGCTETPSFRVDWRLIETEDQSPEDAAPLTDITQCAAVGVTGVRVTTVPKRASGETTLCDTPVDQREFSCLEGGPVEGPTLEPGEYVVFVHGLRRAGEPWACAVDVPQNVLVPILEDDGTPKLDEDGNPTYESEEQCLPDDQPCYARATFELSVDESASASPGLSLVGLLTPPECDDGLDNDRDGKVDSQDPGCIIDASGIEASERGVTLFQTTVSFLDSRVVLPANVGVHALQLDVDGQPFATVGAGELDVSRWPFGVPLLISRTLTPGPHTLSMTAVGSQTLTQAFEFDFDVIETNANYVVWDVGFTGDTFLEDIVLPFGFGKSLLLQPDSAPTSTCTLGGWVGNTRIPVERLRVRVRDENGQPVDAAGLGLQGSYQLELGEDSIPILPVDEADGWVSFECPTANVRSQPLLWGHYSIEIEAQAGGDTCFELNPDEDWLRELAPQSTLDAQGFTLTRVDGPLAPGCVECGENGRTCGDKICVDGLCVDKTNG